MIVTRPVLRWLGGKFRLAPWIIEQMPPHKIYLEPFGGAMSVLLRKPRAYNEIYNDLDGDLVNLFQVLRGPQSAELLRQLRLTPYSRAEYKAACLPTVDPVERARRMLVRSHMAHGTGSARIDRPTGFRSDGRSATTNVAGEWAKFPEALVAVIDRLQGVALEQSPALDLIKRYDTPSALIYLDPPYVSATRSTKSRQQGERYHTYAFELSDQDHEELLGTILCSSAMIMISGYPTALYDRALKNWKRSEVASRAHKNSPRTEVLWINQAAVEAMQTDMLASIDA